jgi:protein-S-isoprenylcysteine O-methyltransferase Ste14
MNALELKIPPLVQVLIIAGLMGLIAAVSRDFLVPLAIRWWGALLLLGPGIILVLAGVWCFRRRGTTVNPLQPDTASSLVTSGVYRLSRNPMYAGFLLCLCGWGVYLGNPFALLGPVVFVLYMNRFQIIPEERVLARLFGAEYDAYRRLVRRWL